MCDSRCVHAMPFMWRSEDSFQELVLTCPPFHPLVELGSLVSAVLCTPGPCLAAGVLGIQEHTITPGYLGRGDLGSSHGRLVKQVTHWTILPPPKCFFFFENKHQTTREKLHLKPYVMIFSLDEATPKVLYKVIFTEVWSPWLRALAPQSWEFEFT